MTEPVVPIIPTNPNIFPVPAVELPRIGPEEREQRRREREEEEGGPRPRSERRTPQPPPERAAQHAAPQSPQPITRDDDGHEHVDVTA